MSIHAIIPGIYSINLGFVRAFLLETEDGLILVDAGMPNRSEKILAAIGSLGKASQDVKQIVITHLHVDHTGGLAEIQKATGAEIWGHADEADAIQSGVSLRPIIPAPGLFNTLMTRLLMPILPKPESLEPVKVSRTLREGDILPGDWQVLHTPGHTVGHICLRKRETILLGDALTNWVQLGYPPIFEDFEQGKITIRQVAQMDIENALFSHGSPIMGDASAKFRRKWLAA